MMRQSHDRPVVPLAELIHSHRVAILAAWKERVSRLPKFEGPSPIANGARVLEWLGRSVASQNGRVDVAEATSDVPFEPRFSAPRAIAELALLTDTIDQLRAESIDDGARDLLHGVIVGAITNSIARDADESDRLRKRLRLATDVTSVGCWELDPASGVVTTDSRSRELFAMVANDAATLEVLTQRVHEEDRGRVRAGIANMLASGQPYIDECRTARLEESSVRWIAIAADAHQGVSASAPTVLGIVHDVTDGKRAEEEHARVVDELSRAVHISEMFVGILSHDLRNPLSAILGGAQLLAMDAKDDKVARVLKLVVSSGERMGRMIDQLLDFTRARLGEGIPLERDAFDLGNLARDVVAEGQAGSAASLLRHTVHGDTVGAWDRDRVNQILTNLVGNAMQHGRAHGAIDIVVDGLDPNRVTLSLENEGCVPADLLPVIFNPFRGTLHTRGKSRGLGLGLYVARQIALAHGGELIVATTASGTKFTLSLPRTSSRATPAREALVREEELAAIDRMAAQPTVSAVTAQLFGATPLHERAPLEHANLVERYCALLEKALQRKAYRLEGDGLSEELRTLAERLGDLGAGPREVTDVHARGLRRAARGATAAKTQALLGEGRLLALELMGNLASYYRRRSRGQSRASATGGSR